MNQGFRFGLRQVLKRALVMDFVAARRACARAPRCGKVSDYALVSQMPFVSAACLCALVLGVAATASAQSLGAGGSFGASANTETGTVEVDGETSGEAAPRVAVDAAAENEKSGSSSDDAATTPSAQVTNAPIAVRELDERVNRLKDNVYRLKATLALLAESVLEGAISGSRAVVVFENKMSPSYKLTRVSVAVDGRSVFDRADETGSMGDAPHFEVYNGNLEPGPHTVTVNLEFAGRGHGVFAYLKGYRFRTRATHSFTSPEGKTLHVKAVAFEEGRPSRGMQDRASVRFAERFSTLRLAVADSE